MNKETLDLIKEFEGEILKVYADPIGLWTLGCGHLLTTEEKKIYKLGQVITQAESDAFLTKDLSWAERAVDKLVKVPLTDNRKGALISLVFNIGERNFAKSSVLRETNDKNFTAAANAFALWNRAGGKVLKGLTRRRAAEKALFEKK